MRPNARLKILFFYTPHQRLSCGHFSPMFSDTASRHFLKVSVSRCLVGHLLVKGALHCTPTHTNALPSESHRIGVCGKCVRRPRRTVQRMTHIQVNNHKTYQSLPQRVQKLIRCTQKEKTRHQLPLILHTCPPRSTTRCWRFTVAASITCSWIHGIGASTIPQRCAVELRANGWKPHNFNDPRHDGTDGLLLLLGGGALPRS